jgi:DNA repair photolyase
LDFETKIMVKPDADTLLAQQFNRPSWQPQVVMMSGDTDCYQPIEKKLQITRRCLEVFLSYRNPVSVVTKNALIQRDIDVLKELATLNLVLVTISITSLDADLIRHMEPRSAMPAKRLETIEALAKAGIPVGVNACPIIPALNDEEIPSILREAAGRGARFAGYTIVRLPHAVKDIFVEWLKRELPDRALAILSRIRSVRNGELTCSDFGTRLNGEGEIAATIEQLFQASCRRYRLNETHISLSTKALRSPSHSQMEIF